MAAKFNYNDNDDVDHCKSTYTDKDTEDFKFDLIPDFVFDQIYNFSNANNKSTGVDSVCIRLLKLAAPIICLPLSYNYMYTTFPC